MLGLALVQASLAFVRWKGGGLCIVELARCFSLLVFLFVFPCVSMCFLLFPFVYFCFLLFFCFSRFRLKPFPVEIFARRSFTSNCSLTLRCFFLSVFLDTDLCGLTDCGHSVVGLWESVGILGPCLGLSFLCLFRSRFVRWECFRRGTREVRQSELEWLWNMHTVR